MGIIHKSYPLGWWDVMAYTVEVSIVQHGVEVAVLRSRAIMSNLAAIAMLRIAVFREYPYLYDGSLDYEEQYLTTYAKSPDSVAVIARDGGRIVGAATAVPMQDAGEAVHSVFRQAGYVPDKWLYHGESVLLPQYRGLGLGVRFFAEREKHARFLGLTDAALCAVLRPDGHLLRPPGYVPLHDFWRKRGYQPMENMVCYFSWKDIDEKEETPKPLAFWSKKL